MSSCLPRLFGLALFVIGVGLAIYGIGKYFDAQASSDWPTTQGKITSSSVKTNRDKKGKQTYGVAIAYSYEIDGQAFPGNTVTFSDYSSNDRGRAERIVKKYPVGKQVTVYYKPTDRETAVLEPGVGFLNYVIPGIAVIMAIVGLLVLLFVGRSSKPADPFAAPQERKKPAEDPRDSFDFSRRSKE